jgi:hypothetical protein
VRERHIFTKSVGDLDRPGRGVSGSSTDHGEEASGRHRPETAMAEALGTDWAGGTLTVDTSLVRECLELILMLADALDQKRARPPTTVSPHSLPATPDVSSEHPPLGISDDEAGVHLLDGPRWPEAADRYDPGRQCPQSPSAAALSAAEVPFGTEGGWDVRSQSDLQR